MVRNLHPSALKDALSIRAAGTVVPYAGGTDLMIKHNDNAEFLFLDRITEMKNITEDSGCLRIGAACTFTDILESSLTPAFLKEVVAQIGAPAIRNLGTVGGNICNGSAKADSALAFFVTDARLRLKSVRGERVIPISEFYSGEKKTALLPDELLVEIVMDQTGTERYYYKKVGARNALAISRVSFAAVYDLKDGKIAAFRTAFGAIGDVIFGRPDIDAMMTGKTIEEARAVKADYLKAYESAVNPIKGRVSAEYRKSVCLNLLRDFLETSGI
jgi:CO/xanthine dehydrogenase FAD-binding subunit